MVLSELLAIMGNINKETSDANNPTSSTNNINIKSSELFDHIVYLSEVCDVLAIAMAELPNLLTPADVAEALLRLKYGPEIICHMVANQPDTFSDGELRVFIYLLVASSACRIEANLILLSSSFFLLLQRFFESHKSGVFSYLSNFICAQIPLSLMYAQM